VKHLVRFFGHPCGELSIDNERFSFRYLDSYIAADLQPVSVCMPVSPDVYVDAIVFPFFENLLPEGAIRTLLAERLKTAENNYSRLLEVLGGDIAGALSVTGTEDVSFQHVAEFAQALTKRQLGQVLKQIELTPFLAETRHGLRLSLAGAQHKIPLLMFEKELYLPVASISTHIVKPPSLRFKSLVENEYLCMKAAKRVGLNTPCVQLIPFVNADGEELDCFVIERYDRQKTAQGIKRIHQEDLCQIEKIPSAQKYTHDGGPDYRALFEAVRRYTKPSAIHQNELIRRLLFNLLIGNNDAHGKNFSFLHHGRMIALAPAYDLVSTAVYDELNQHFAMPFGPATDIGRLNKTALHEFESSTGVNLQRQSKSLIRFLNEALAALQQEAEILEAETYPDAMLLISKIINVARRNHAILIKLLTP